MLNLAEYRQRPALLADWLPWAGLIAPGVVLNKDGSFQRTARFRGPDLDSATQGELIAITARLNNALRRLGSGWALFVEAERQPAADYPHSDFPEPLSWLVDEERRAAFEESGHHFESTYHLTLAYLPPEESRARAAKLLYEHAPGDGVDWHGRLDAFAAETDRVFDLLDGVMPEIAWLDDAQTLTYLHATVSTRRYRVGVPEVPFHLDALLADSALVGGLAPMLGDQHLRVVSVRGFPTSTWPGLLDDLNRLGFAYRWSTRFLCLDKAEAEKELGRLRRQWFAKRKNVIALLRETIFQQESPLVDTDASNKAADADAALQELGSDQVAFGYLTATVTVLDGDPAMADEKLRMVERVIQGRGFVTIPETLNAVDAWLSSIPGNAYANVRQPIVSTLNLAHMMPVSAVWAGPEKNAHLDGPPLIVTRTDGATPFRLVTHIGDVGHTLVAGPTGMGKSVLLAMLALQFRRYFGSRIFAFDMGRSMRATVLGLGGRTLRPGRGRRHCLPATRAHRRRRLPHLGGRMDRGPLAARRRDRRPRRESRYLVGAGKPCRCAGGTAYDDRAFGAAAIERAAPSPVALCARRRARQAAGCRPRPARQRRRAGLRDGRTDAQPCGRASGAALPVRPLRCAFRRCADAADPR